MDKDGNYYDVVTKSWSDDAGRIAGGSMNYSVVIKKANGSDDAIFNGWSGIFSTPHYACIVDDIKNGYYLEDYIAKNWGALSNEEKFKELKDKGDSNAKSHHQEKEDDKVKKQEEFAERYIILPKYVNFVIDNGKLEFENLCPKQEMEGKPEKSVWQLSVRDFDSEEAYKNAKSSLQEQWNEYNSKLKDINNKLTDVVNKIASKLTEEYFKTSVSNLNGLKFSIIPKKKDEYLNAIAIDTKRNKVITLNRKSKNGFTYTPWKDINENPEFKLGPVASISKYNASDYLKDLFKRVADGWQKINSRTKTKYIEDHWEKIWQDGRGMYPWNPDRYTKGEAKKIAERDFYKWLNDFNWGSVKSVIEFDTSFIKDYIQGDIPEIEKVEDNKGSSNVDISKARKTQEPKMDAWHNGTRKQNVSSCSDSKLKLNYEICKDKGYDKEAEILKKEAESRGLTLESLNLNDMRFSIIETLYLN